MSVSKELSFSEHRLPYQLQLYLAMPRQADAQLKIARLDARNFEMCDISADLGGLYIED